MAQSAYAVNHPLAVKLWAKKLLHEVYGSVFFSKFIGKDDSALVQIKDETQKGPGDRITVGLRMLLTGSGVQGDGTLEGNEEALTLYTDQVFIDQLRNAVVSGGKMSEQRVPFSVREEARMGLQDWWVERLDTSMANQLTGNTAQTDVRYTGMQSAVGVTTVAGTTRLLVGNGETAETSLSATTSHAITLQDLDKAVAVAKTQSPRIRPLRVEGQEYFVAFLHPYQIYQLRRQSGNTVATFYDVHKSQMMGGKIKDNPIVTGAEFTYNNVLVHQWSYLPQAVSASTNSNYRRGVFCGAQAAVLAFGQDNGPEKVDWVEKLFNYENQLGVSAGMIFGIKKLQFNSSDFSTIVLSGYAPAP